MEEKEEKFDLKKFNNSYYNRQEKGLIEIGLEDIDDFYSPYSLKSNKQIDKDVDDHITNVANYIPINKDIDLDIYLEKMPDSKTQKEAITTFRKSYAEYLLELNAEKKRLLILASILFLIGISFLTCLFVLNLSEKSLFVYSLVEIAAWVFVWEALDISCFHCHSINVKSKRAKKLLNADITFKTYKKESNIVKHTKSLKK